MNIKTLTLIVVIAFAVLPPLWYFNEFTLTPYFHECELSVDGKADKSQLIIPSILLLLLPTMLIVSATVLKNRKIIILIWTVTLSVYAVVPISKVVRKHKDRSYNQSLNFLYFTATNDKVSNETYCLRIKKAKLSKDDEFSCYYYRSIFTLMEELIHKGFDVSRTTYLYNAVEWEDEEMFWFLLQNGADVNCRDLSKEETPLFAAVKNENKEMRDALLKQGADIFAKDKFNSNLLFTMVRSKKEHSFEDFEWLINGGLDVNEKNDLGLSPLFLAVNIERLEAAKILLEAGADVFITNNEGKGVMECKSVKENPELETLLLSYISKNN